MSSRDKDDVEALKYAALEKLPTYNRVHNGIFFDEGIRKEIDIDSLGFQEKKKLLERLVRVTEEDNKRFLLKLKGRIDRVGLDFPTIEVWYEHLNIEALAYAKAEGKEEDEKKRQRNSINFIQRVQLSSKECNFHPKKYNFYFKECNFYLKQRKHFLK
ncbi:pleiotropic drug resistance protein 1-like [Ananas comosus]|uniref:Pleiotropic drug resistance protein 1-like n=1 Tax=Ananas comosus TaxID=4615 RepID=A0A6P5EP90_ANACO|nr:pleiotropic drug resistance protein 1-like [Ananas comosus]